MDNFHNFNTPMLNIDELHDKEREKTSRKFEVYRKILEKCHNKVRDNSAKREVTVRILFLSSS